jgi:hypothetical protein
LTSIGPRLFRGAAAQGKPLVQPDFRFVVSGQSLFGAFEFRRMNSLASIRSLRDSEVEMQHFMKKRARDDNIGNSGIIQRPVNRDNPRLDIANAEDDTPAISRPSQHGTGELIPQIAFVQDVEEDLEVIDLPSRFIPRATSSRSILGRGNIRWHSEELKLIYGAVHHFPISNRILKHLPCNC